MSGGVGRGDRSGAMSNSRLSGVPALPLAADEPAIGGPTASRQVGGRVGPTPSAPGEGESDAVGVTPSIARIRRARPRVLVGIKSLPFHQQVLDFLERDPRVEVAGAAATPDRLLRLAAELRPDMAVLCPTMARDLRHPAAGERIGPVGPLLVVAEEMTVPALREAIDVGAAGFFAWPEERAELAEVVLMVPPRDRDPASSRGKVIAVHGVRGGAGATFVATHLAAFLADRKVRTCLVDLDPGFAQMTVALGIDPEDGARTIADLIPVADELSPDHLEDALYRHPRGFSVLLTSQGDSDSGHPPAALFGACVALLACAFEAVVLHIPRGLDGVVRVGVGLADEVVLVANPDVFSLHGALRTMTLLGLNGPSNRCRLVINKRSRSDVYPEDFERVLGLPPTSTIRFDSSIRPLQDRGQLLRRGARRSGKDLRKIAARLAPTVLAPGGGS